MGSEDIPSDPWSNTAAIAASEVLETLGVDGGVKLKIEKGIRPKSGMGSSGASAVAGALAVNELYGASLSKEILVEAAARGERKVAGSIHYDNVAAALLGGFTIVTSTDPLEFFKLEVPQMKIVLAQPSIGLPTALGRELLPSKVSLEAAVANVGRASTMVAALRTGDLKTFGKCMIDSLAEPFRFPLIPGFSDVKRSALQAGAVGTAMAGSGPSIFAIVEPEGDAELVARAMEGAFKRANVGCETLITFPGEGARILERE